MFEKVQKIEWKEFFKVEKNRMVLFKLIPHQSVTNQGNRKLWQMLHKLYEMYDSIPSRFTREGWKVSFREKDRIWFDVVYRCKDGKKTVEFFMATSETWAKKFKETVEHRMKCHLEEVPFESVHVPLQNTVVQELKYTRHDVFSMKHDYREELTPISSVVGCIDDLDEGDVARLSFCGETVNRRKWGKLSEYAHEKISEGKIPKRNRITFTGAIATVSDGVAWVLNELNDILRLIFNAFQNVMMKGYTKPDDVHKKEKAVDRRKLIDEIETGRISSATYEKKYSQVWKVHCRAVAHSESRQRRNLIVNSLSSFSAEIHDNNELTGITVRFRGRKNEIINELNTFQLSKRTLADNDANVVSCDEIGKMIQLPTKALQMKYADELKVNKTIETEISSEFLKGGIHIGEYTNKGETVPVYKPVKNHDELCLPTCVLGGMGQGKTAGFGANYVVQAVKNGFGALSIDPKDFQIRDEVKSALPPEKIVNIVFGEIPISLDWCEVHHSPKAKGRLANTIIGFFNNNATDEAGVQTARYLRAMVMGMRTGKLAEIMRIMEDKEYRTEVANDLKDGIHKSTLLDMNEMSDGKLAQILAPIYNRLDVILGEPYLEDCMNSDNSIDLVELMSQRKAVVIDVPKSLLSPQEIDLIVSLLTTKIDLAMTLRKEKNRFPFFVVYDEPHQMIKSTKVWESAVVESRYWRIGYVWLFHSWEQIPNKLANIMKSALPNYHLYPSSKDTFKELKEEIAPITVEEALQLKTYHAINVIRSGGEATVPFVAHMTPPPSMQQKQLQKAG